MDPKTIDRAARAAVWWKGLCESNNETFLPLFTDESRYLVLVGGGGSGKSIFAGRKIIERVTSEPGHRWLVCRKVARTLRESCYSQLIGQLSEHYEDSGYRANKSDFKISFPNGSEILFAGLDDVEKLKSIYNITGIWIEEASEITEADFNQLDIRLRGETNYYKQIIVTLNPVSITHWIKARFFDRRDPRARTHHSTYQNNRFLDAEAIRTLEAYRDTDEYYYQVYCLGMWGVTGKSVFDAKKITERLRVAPKPGKVGYFAFDDDGQEIKRIRWVEDPDGFIRLYRDVRAGVPYVIGGDTAGEGSDRFVAQVLDNTTGEQVATLRSQFDEDVYAKQMYCLGEYYNTALIGIETNWSTYPVMELERLRYKRQYVRETVDDFTHRIKHAFGFVTNTKTRPIILSELIRIVREDVALVNDVDTMHEMLTFVRNEAFRPEAEAGAHDDCVMALAIAHFIRTQQSYLVTEYAGGMIWTADMWEDYRRAGADAKRYLLKKWGKPR